MKAKEIEAASRKAAEDIMVEMAGEFAPVIRKLSMDQLGTVLGAIQLGYARGALASANYMGERIKTLVPGLGELVKPRRRT